MFPKIIYQYEQPRESNGQYSSDKKKAPPQPYEPNGSNRPPDSQVTIKFNGARIGSTGNLTVLASWAGAGKSAVCEAICASYLNKCLYHGVQTCDSLGLECFLPPTKKILYVDGERSTEDNWYSWRRILNRARLPYNEMNRQIMLANEIQSIVGNLRMQAHCTLNSIEDRMNVIENVISKESVGMIIIDGIGDLIMDANHAENCTKIWLWINSLLQKGVSIFSTIHTNPGSEKARGHLGSEWMRRGEGVMLLDCAADKTRTLTTDFDMGKVRNGDKTNTVCFSWNDDEHMFTTVSTTPQAADKAEANKKAKLQSLANALDDDKEYSYGDLSQIFQKKERISDKTAERRIKDLVENKYIFKNDKGNYTLNAF